MRSSLHLGRIAICVFVLATAHAQNARLSGRVREAGSGKPIASAQLKLEGAALAGRENSLIIRKVNPVGGYTLDAPPGTYHLWVLAPNFQELKLKITLAAGATEERNFDLEPSERLYAYRVETLRLPQQMIPEVSGVAFTPQGSMIVTNRRGEVWIRRAAGEWRRFATGLYEGFGLVAVSESELLVIQRPELTRVRDNN